MHKFRRVHREGACPPPLRATQTQHMTTSFSYAKHLVATFAFVFLFSVVSTAHAATVPLSTIASGDLIRGNAFSAVYYYGADGFRYVFPNDKIYFTWYKDFKTVKWVSDADLSKIQIGGNVTYKPGVKMLKINSDPTVYAISQNGTLRAIGSEAVAKTLYGITWNKQIDDLPDGFFGNYHIGGKLEFASQFSPASEKLVASVNEDKKLLPATVIHITDTGYTESTIHLTSGRAVRFVNDGLANHSATEWDGIWGSGTLKPGETFSKYFSMKGTWTYYSMYDSKNTFEGAIIVE